jgi:hypothetical protein
MRKAIFILGIILAFSISAAAQGPMGVGSQGGYFTDGEHPNDPWQVSLGYQYNRDNLLGSPFNTSGLNVSATRFFGRWLGVEAQLGTGFLGTTGETTTPPKLSVKSIFVGAGPRLAFRTGSRYEPWAHLVVGLEHYRFSQTAGLLGSNNALGGAAGGGMDIYLRSHLAVRVEADFIGTRFFSTDQRSFQVIGGVVFGF